MLTRMVPGMLLATAGFLAFGGSGCATFICRTGAGLMPVAFSGHMAGDGPHCDPFNVSPPLTRPFLATQVDMGFMLEAIPVGFLLGLVDLPMSLAFDGVFLPFDLVFYLQRLYRRRKGEAAAIKEEAPCEEDAPHPIGDS